MRVCLCCLTLLPLLVAAGDPVDSAGIGQRIATISKELAVLPDLPPPQPSARVGFHSGFVGTTQAARWVQIDLGESRDFDSVVVVPAFFASTGQASGAYGMPPRFRVDASDEADFGSYQTLADHTEADVPASISPLFITAKSRARYVRFTATRLAQQRLGRGFFALGELFVFSGPVNVAATAPVMSSGAYETQPTWMLGNLTDGLTHLGAPITPATLRSNGWHSGIATSADQTKWVQVDLGVAQPLDEVRLYSAHPPDFPERPGFGFPVRFRLEAGDDAAFAHPQVLLDASAADFVNPADNPVSVPGRGVTARYLRMTATRLWERAGDYVIALGELEAYSQGRNVASGAAVTSSDETKTPAWSGAMLVDGHTSLGAIQPWPQWLAQLSRRQELTAELAMLRSQQADFSMQRQKLWLVLAVAAIVLSAGIGLWLHRRQRLQQRRALNDLRRQIARDLHDEIGSSLGSIALMSELALRDGDQAAMQDIHRLSREAAESMRGIIWLVREPGLPTLERLVETMRQTSGSLLGGVAWDLHAPQDVAPPAPSLDFHRHVFLFFKEAVHNIARHAQAKTVRMDVTWTPQDFNLTLEDDGIGFDLARSCGGSGLENLRHRAAALHGRVEITSNPGHGTCIHLTVPLHTS